MNELVVTMIPAGSPQAKGRIERLWGTLQDRLVQKFILNRIKDIESNNKFMKKYIPKFNRRFSVEPKGKSVFRKLKKGVNIDYILCRKYPRKLDSGSAFSYGGNTLSFYPMENRQLLSRTPELASLPAKESG